MKTFDEGDVSNQEEQNAEQPSDISEPRRKAVGKLVYASPVIASIVFSQKGAAQFTPPAPPGG